MGDDLPMPIRQYMKICDGVNFAYIKENKFKTSHISFTMFLPLNSSDVSKNALVPSILERSCKKYPSFSLLNKRLDELFGANITSGIDRLGETQVLTISASCISDKFSFDGSNITHDVSDLLKQVIFDPYLVNGEFDKEAVEQEKRQLIETIESEYNDKRTYARRKCEQIMCHNEKFGINKYGTVDNVKAITPRDVTDAWKYILKSAHIEIMMIGSTPYEPVLKSFSDAFSNIERKNIVDCKTQIIHRAEKVNQVTEEMSIIQCKLTMGFRTDIALPSDDIASMRLMAALLGGTPHSKLFINVREKLSLCYYCSSSYDKYKGIMMIESGVQLQNIETAKKEILHQLDDIKLGNFDDEQLEATRMAIRQSFEKVGDKLESLDDWYIFQTFSGKVKTPEQSIKEINEVTRNQVIEAANKVSLDTIYILAGKDE